MPIYPPRSEPVKKQEELTKREMELVFAIRKNVATDKLIKAVDKYRQAQLSMLKAKVHTFKENEYQKKPNNVKLEKLEELTIEWTDKTNDEIINEVKKSNNL
ncbi:hypothetical protein [Niabella ginsengisoli]|uniref:Uncharacterized protein n=1 Tax=Niabella ginsengisoli TaxID=522298 RepID=A0ABS9SKI4_9BACT|nr:hypothetical protein [Niabella ginsengisoli]MCH5598669.1 hypothetical protein [Niabella ginsengisoli]